MSAPEGFLVTRSGRRLSRKSFLKPEPFPFLKLPGEVRNMIYRFALAQGAARTSCKHSIGVIGVENLDPLRYNRNKARGRMKYRKSYWTGDFSVNAPCCSAHCNWDFDNTTYTLPEALEIPSRGFLRANRQIRSEAEPIFYGENIFSFRDMSAVRPFLRDRTPTARQSIRHVILSFVKFLDDMNHLERQDEWIKVFQYIALCLNLKALDVCFSDASQDFFTCINFERQDQRWVHALAQIRGLHHFTFDLDIIGRDEFVESLIDNGNDDDTIENELEELDYWISETDAEYEMYFKSRMLKKTQSTLVDWLDDHECITQCDEIRKGRAAVKRGLPRSETQGRWVLPERRGLEDY
ncbi:MAG: hypothetical protein Q9170_004969 [Blastenia crenularia]